MLECFKLDFRFELSTVVFPWHFAFLRPISFPISGSFYILFYGPVFGVHLRVHPLFLKLLPLFSS
jgi:hypothetical protein